MAQDTKYSVRDLKKDFPNDGACLDYLFDQTHSRTCSCGGTYARVAKRQQFQCSKCRFQIAPMAGTIFQKSSTPLTLWFHAVFIFSNAKSGISAKEMERQLGVTYKTAWRILNLIRKSLSQGSSKLGGDIEMDEGYIGGKGYGGKNNKGLGDVMKKKSTVLGAVQRGGEMKAEVVDDAKAKTIGQFIQKNVDWSVVQRFITDGSNRYHNNVFARKHHSVDHGRQEYVRGDIHVNNIETFWSHVKRSIKGTHKSISKQHLQSYLDGFVFHRNNAGNDKMRFQALLGALV